tara:strand:- start:888 stop:1229 length:342 start_codon:yes stop_codon:yes gene_type:complete
MKKVQVQMSDECHAVLKSYAAFYGKTMSEILYMFTRQEIQQQSLHCKFVQQLLDAQGIRPDKRAHKPCWGHQCLNCKHANPCLAGLTEETFMPTESVKKHLKPDSPSWDLYKD